MKNYNEMFSLLKNKISNQFNLLEFKYSNNIFTIKLELCDFKKITCADILIFNHKTKQYRIFNYISHNEKEIIFQNSNLFLKIIN